MSSSNSEYDECKNKTPVKRSYKQNPNKNKNIHPRTAQRWKSKLDSGLNAELSLFTSRNSELRPSFKGDILVPSFGIDVDTDKEMSQFTSGDSESKQGTQPSVDSDLLLPLPETYMNIDEEKETETAKKRPAPSASYSTTSTDRSTDSDRKDSSSGEEEFSSTSESDDDKCHQNNFCAQSGDHSKTPVIKFPVLPEYNDDESPKNGGNNVAPEMHSSFAETDNEPHLLDTTKIKDYYLGDSEVMFEEAGLKISNVMLMIFGFSVRFSLSYKARRALIDMVRVFAGPRFKNWDISDYYLSDIFDPPDSVIKYHFYCLTCFQPLEPCTTKKKFKNHTKICEKCLQQYKLSINSPNSFISISILYQLKTLLQTDHIRTNLFQNLNNILPNLPNDGNIRDVYDGELYRKFLSESQKGERVIVLTFIFYTDGASLFHSSIQSFWPQLIVLNELSPHLRFKYPLLAGIWKGKKEPRPALMNTCLQPFVEQVQDLSTKGFTWINDKGETFRILLKPLLCSVDTVARPILQNRVQYNGHYGCSWCYSYGDWIDGSMRFLMKEEDPLLRTHLSHMEDVKSALTVSKTSRKRRNTMNPKKGKIINGVKGYSVLSEMQTVDMVWSFIRDYLHADLLGVTLHLWKTWNDKRSPINLSNSDVDKINERILQMTPPHENHRLPRSLKSETCKWKATEWRSWLLFYAEPCLQGILNACALKHFALFSNSIFTLLQRNITKEELDQCEVDLLRFVGLFEVLYGEGFVTFNVHSLLHLVPNVRKSGPIWSTSNFPSENTIFYLKECVHSPKGIYEQMAKKTLQANVFKSVVQESTEISPCLSYCESLFSRNEVQSYCRSSAHDVVFIGKGNQDSNNLKLSKKGTDVITFSRCTFRGMIVHSVQYCRPQKRNDTVFRLCNGEYIRILKLLYFDEESWAEVQYFIVEKFLLTCGTGDFPCSNCNVVNFYSKNLMKVLTDKGEKEVILLSKISEKCVFVNVDNEMYISTLPNIVEIQ